MGEDELVSPDRGFHQRQISDEGLTTPLVNFEAKTEQPNPFNDDEAEKHWEGPTEENDLEESDHSTNLQRV